MEVEKISNLDFKKYGFEFIPINENLDTYQREFKDLHTTIEVWVSDNLITIHLMDSLNHRQVIFRKFYCETQENLEFLLFNGELAPLFDQNYFSSNKRSDAMDRYCK